MKSDKDNRDMDNHLGTQTCKDNLERLIRIHVNSWRYTNGHDVDSRQCKDDKFHQSEPFWYLGNKFSSQSLKLKVFLSSHSIKFGFVSGSLQGQKVESHSAQPDGQFRWQGHDSKHKVYSLLHWLKQELSLPQLAMHSERTDQQKSIHSLAACISLTSIRSLI